MRRLIPSPPHHHSIIPFISPTPTPLHTPLPQAYEVDGYGNSYFADDANVPSLLSLPYLGYVDKGDKLYRSTRAGVLSAANPWFFSGAAGGEGIGGPHVGINMIWPMSVIMRALTATDAREAQGCVKQLLGTTGNAWLMHESYNKDDPGDYSRPWFAWANALFGDLIATMAETMPGALEMGRDGEGGGGAEVDRELPRRPSTLTRGGGGGGGGGDGGEEGAPRGLA